MRLKCCCFSGPCRNEDTRLWSGFTLSDYPSMGTIEFTWPGGSQTVTLANRNGTYLLSGITDLACDSSAETTPTRLVGNATTAPDPMATNSCCEANWLDVDEYTVTIGNLDCPSPQTDCTDVSLTIRDSFLISVWQNDDDHLRYQITHIIRIQYFWQFCLPGGACPLAQVATFELSAGGTSVNSIVEIRQFSNSGGLIINPVEPTLTRTDSTSYGTNSNICPCISQVAENYTGPAYDSDHVITLEWIS